MRVFFPGKPHFVRKVGPRPQRVPGTMNKAEARYAQHLELLKRDGLIQDFLFEAIKFRLAEKTFYTVDFIVICKDVVECHEFKGFMRDDAAVKFKVAAAKFPWFSWIMVKETKNGFVKVMEI
jgi:hypothetical protein